MIEYIENKKIKCLDISKSNVTKKINNYFLNNNHNIFFYNKNKICGYVSYDTYINNIYSPIKDLIKPCIEYNKNNLKKEADSYVKFNSNGKIILEYNKLKKDNLEVDLSRYNILYSDNNLIIDYIRTMNIKKIYILNDVDNVFYYSILMYGNDFEIIQNYKLKKVEDLVNILKCKNTLVIDCNNKLSYYKKIIFQSVKLTNGINNSMFSSLNDLCKNAELYFFVEKILTNNKIKTFIFSLPKIEELTNITEEEKIRIKFDHHYRYYYDRYKDNKNIKALLKKVFSKYFSDEFIESRNHLPNVIMKSGRFFLENSDNPFCRSFNGVRHTTNQDKKYIHNLNIFGPCTVFGALVDDRNTIPSNIQRIINYNKLDYLVTNYGARAIDLVENIRTMESINIKEGDCFVFVVSPEEKNELNNFGYNKIYELKSVFNNSNLNNYFIDEPVHCNHIANYYISKFIMNKITKKLEINSRKYKNKNAKIVSVSKSRCIFDNNKFLDEYIAFLKRKKRNTFNNGCILMNCNPFTLGHQKLVDYASKKVETLYVFVVQEDKSYFKFKDRFKMVKEGCKNFKNVEVLPSGVLFASAMLFPNYFNREENPNVLIDVSLDRELFTQYIAPTLNIKYRFLGQELVDDVTRAYNNDLKNNMPFYGIEIIEIPRYLDYLGRPISAKVVRNLILNNDWEEVKKLVPNTTLNILKKIEGKVNKK